MPPFGRSPPEDFEACVVDEAKQIGQSVCLLFQDDLVDRTNLSRNADRDARVMMALDEINRRWGRNSAIIGAAGLRTGWTPKFERRSPRYTTKLSDLPLC